MATASWRGPGRCVMDLAFERSQMNQESLRVRAFAQVLSVPLGFAYGREQGYGASSAGFSSKNP